MFDPSQTLRDLEALARREAERAARGASLVGDEIEAAAEAARRAAQMMLDTAEAAVDAARRANQAIADTVDVGREGCNLVIRVGNATSVLRIPGCEDNPPPIVPLPPLNLPDLPPDPPPRPPDWPGGRPDPNTYVEIITNRPPFFGAPDPDIALRATKAECIQEYWDQSRLAALTGRLYAPTRIGTVFSGPDQYLVRTTDRGWGFAVEVLQGDRWQFVGYDPTDHLSAGEGDPITSHRVYWVANSTNYIDRFDPNSPRQLFVQWRVETPTGVEWLVSPDDRWATNREDLGRGHQFFLRNQTRFHSVERSLSDFATFNRDFGRWRGLVGQLDELFTHPYPPRILGVFSRRSIWTSLPGIGCHPMPPDDDPPPPPPPPPREPMEKCDDRLLRFILAKLERIEKTLAAPEFFDLEGDKDTGKVKSKKAKDLPKAPERLIYPKKRGDKSQMAIPNLLTLGEFLIRQIDRAMGAFPLKAKISDGEKTEKGNQPVEVEIESIADGLRELVEIGIESKSDTEIIQLMQHRNLLEVGIVHHAGVKMESMIRAIVEYLDFKLKYKVKQVPFYFDPTAGVQRGKGFGMWVLDAETMEPEEQVPDAPDTGGELEKILPLLLKENMQKIRVMEWDESEKRSLNDKIEEILRNVIISANAVGVEATPENLENLVKHTRVLVKLQNLQQQSNVQAAMTSGKLTRRKQ